jgi:hypothetical protein
MRRMWSPGGWIAYAAIALVVAFVWAGSTVRSASADGTCGRHDASGVSACPVSGSASTYNGSLTPTYDPYPFYAEKDYYVFHARAGTALIITLHDEESPACESTYLTLCGDVSGELEDRSGDLVAESKGGLSGEATVNAAGVPVAATVSDTIRSSGTYYLVVSGALGRDLSVDAPETELAVPYSFGVSAHPGVVWPPPCVVPQVRRNTTLVRGELGLRHAGCRVGRIRYSFDTHVAVGDVIAFRPHAGRVLPRRTRVEVIVATHHR